MCDKIFFHPEWNATRTYYILRPKMPIELNKRIHFSFMIPSVIMYVKGNAQFMEVLMFYTMTLNPALDYNLTLQEFLEGQVNRSVKEELIPGGKGLMVSRMLKNLGVDSIAFGLIAGFTGRELERRMQEAGVCTDFIYLP